MKTYTLEELAGLHIFDGSQDYEIESFDKGTNCFIVSDMEYNVENDTFIKTGTRGHLTIQEVKNALMHDNGMKEVKIIL